MAFLQKLISGGIQLLTGAFCATFSHNSPFNLNLGLAGTVTEGQPLMINTAANNMEITNFKVNLRVAGVSIPAIEAYQYGLETISLGGQAPPDNTAAAIASSQQYNPTLAQLTIVAWAIVVVRSPGAQLGAIYNTPAYLFNFAMYKDRLLTDSSLSDASILTKPNTIVYMEYTVLYGHQTCRDFQISFVDSAFPGAILLGPSDWIQFLYFGSNNFTYPSIGQAGIWGRVCGNVSWEIMPPFDPTTPNPDAFKLNSATSAYKHFNRIGS